MAIVHSKAIVIDPFSSDCAVITGSHNFSDSASAKNDENLVIVRGNQKLAQAYALHINGVYDHYSWRAYLGSGGDPDQIFKPLDGWKPGGSRAQELDFWVNEPIPPQSTQGGTSPSSSKKGAKPAGKPKTGKSSKTSKASQAPKKAARAKAKGSRKPTTSRRAVKPKAKRKSARHR